MGLLINVHSGWMKMQNGGRLPKATCQTEIEAAFVPVSWASHIDIC